ncbi:HGGxSTG domain-containing protein [Planctomycetota bacterium]|nr:HGGxSTG domain-containing protein [Planctomycetota bacterium]
MNKRKTPKKARAKCSARTRAGGKCQAPAFFNHHLSRQMKRCRLHGGLSCGPTSEAGKRRSLENLKAGHEAIQRINASRKKAGGTMS